MKNSPAQNLTQNDYFIIGCCLFAFAVSVVWSVFFVPMNMDEAGIYHVLACMDHPFSSLHTFRAPCVRETAITLPIFGLHIIQPGWYTGILQPILYAPFYFLFHAEGAQYVFGLCFLLGFAFLLSRETKKPWLSFALFLAFFPFVFQFVHDTGPVKFALLLFPLTAIILRKMLQPPTATSYGYAAVLALLFVAATEDKPFFIYLMPGLGFFALALLAGDGNLKSLVGRLKLSRKPLITAAILTTVLMLLFLFSTNRDGKYYISWLMDMRVTEHKSDAPATELFTAFLFHWPVYTHYFYNLTGNTLDTLLFKLVTAVLVLLCAALTITGKFLANCKTRTALLALSFLATTIIFAIAGNVWAGHHFIFLWAPLMLLLADLVAALTPGLALTVTAAFVALNLCSVIMLTQENPAPRNSAERDAITAYFADNNRAAQSLINFLSWGDYFIQALYGPKDQLVTYVEPLTPIDAEHLLTLAQKTNRTLYNVCYGFGCNETQLNGMFGNKIEFQDAMPGLSYWHIFVATPKKAR